MEQYFISLLVIADFQLDFLLLLQQEHFTLNYFSFAKYSKISQGRQYLMCFCNDGSKRLLQAHLFVWY